VRAWFVSFPVAIELEEFISRHKAYYDQLIELATGSGHQRHATTLKVMNTTVMVILTIMFESVTPDPGEDGLRRAARIFNVVAVLGAIGAVLFAVAALSSGTFGVIAAIRMFLYAAMAALAWLTGSGIDAQKVWAKWLGIVLGVLELLNVPIGTVIGVAILVYLNRAIKAGLFSPPEAHNGLTAARD